MTTALDRPLKREVLVGGAPFTLIASPTGVRIAPKGHHRPAEVSWDIILTLGQPSGRDTNRPEAQNTDVPKAIAADLARELRTANQALERAGVALRSVGSVPAELIAQFEPDRVYGRIDDRADWFIEPLLTIGEVASILRISKPAALRLPIPSLTIAGERRFRQSEVRQHLTRQETATPRYRR